MYDIPKSMKRWNLQNSLGQCNIWPAGLPCWPCWDGIFALLYRITTTPTPLLTPGHPQSLTSWYLQYSLGQSIGTHTHTHTHTQTRVHWSCQITSEDGYCLSYTSIGTRLFTSVAQKSLHHLNTTESIDKGSDVLRPKTKSHSFVWSRHRSGAE